MTIADQQHPARVDLGTTVAAILIDYDNIEALRIAPSAERFAYVLAKVIDAHLASVDDSVNQLLIRLYGGWNEGGTLTQRASQVAQYMSDADPFPLVRAGEVIAGTLELALGPADRPGLSLPNTFRRRNGSIRLRRDPNLSHPTCPNDQSCGARQLTKWTSKATKVCPTRDCDVTSAQAFLVSEQKMIDTLLTTDLLTMFYVDQYYSVSVVSDDSDFLPPLIHAAQSQGRDRVVLLTSVDWDEDLVRILMNSYVTVQKVSL